MLAEFYIVFKGRTVKDKLYLSGAPRTTMTKPQVAANEVSVKMELDIPDELFMKPLIVVSGKVNAVPSRINEVAIAEEAKKILEEQLNLKVEIKK